MEKQIERAIAEAEAKGSFDGLNSQGRRNLRFRIRKNHEYQVALSFSLQMKLMRSENWEMYDPRVFEFFTIEEYDHLFDTETLSLCIKVLQSREQSLLPLPTVETPPELELVEELAGIERVRACVKLVSLEKATVIDCPAIHYAKKVLCVPDVEPMLPEGPSSVAQTVAPVLHAIRLSNKPNYNFRTKAELQGCIMHLSRVVRRVYELQSLICERRFNSLFDHAMYSSMKFVLFYYIVHICNVPHRYGYRLLFMN